VSFFLFSGRVREGFLISIFTSASSYCEFAIGLRLFACERVYVRVLFVNICWGQISRKWLEIEARF